MIARFSHGLLTWLFVFGLIWPAPADDRPPAKPDEQPVEKTADCTAGDDAKFMRLVRGEDERPTALQTVIAGFESAGKKNPGVRVDLIGAMHIGDKPYYDQLNERFKQYEAVLYELVAPEEANVPKAGQSPGGLIGGAQVGMKTMLDLSFQLDHIDYRAKNMVHADMSPQQFDDTMEERDESWFGLFFRSMGQAYAQQANDPFNSGDWRLIAAMFAEDRAFQLKLVLAEEFADMEAQIKMLSGPDGSTIVTERNKKALEILQREIGQGKRKIAIFYGAGHLPDFQERLEKEFGLKRVQTEWLTAWSLEKPQQPEDKEQDEHDED